MQSQNVRAQFAVMMALAALITATEPTQGKAVSPFEETPSRVRMDVFYANDCQHCKKVEREVFAVLEKRGIGITRYEVSDEKSARALLAIQSLPEFEGVGVDSNGDLPLVFLGRYAFEGEEAIRRNVPRVLATDDATLYTAPHTRAREALVQSHSMVRAEPDAGKVIHIA